MKKIYILFFISLMTVSCNVLDQVSPNDVADANVFKTKAGAEAALVGLYNAMQGKYYYGGYYPMLADLYSEVGTDGGYQNTILDEISNIGVSTSNTIIEDTWLALYYTIATANQIISRVDGVIDPTFTTEERNSIKGQALAIRALAHLDVLRMYGEHWDLASNYGIPVVTTIQHAEDVVPRSTVVEVYNAIDADLQAALGLVDGVDRSQSYINFITIKALQARAFLYRGDFANAILAADVVINDGTFQILDQSNFGKIYTSPYLSKESIFELTYSIQNQSGFNALTYLRDGALRSDVLFLAKATLDTFFIQRPGDLRANLLDFVNNDPGILPDGRTQKYRGEQTHDNPAYIIRIAEVYLIRAEANGLAGGGLTDLNTVRTNRGLAALTIADVPTQADFINALLDERKAELNFEGHRMFDLARTGKFASVVGADKGLTLQDYNAIFPIPNEEIIATKGILFQNQGY